MSVFNADLLIHTFSSRLMQIIRFVLMISFLCMLLLYVSKVVLFGEITTTNTNKYKTARAQTSKTNLCTQFTLYFKLDGFGI